jgi:hypothetical protein
VPQPQRNRRRSSAHVSRRQAPQDQELVHEFVAGNRSVRETTGFTNCTDAAEFLKKRVSDALGGKVVLSKNVTYDDLRALIITDYTNNGRKSLGDLKSTRLPKLDAVFGGSKAIDITTTSVERYKTLRLKDGAAPATVNRKLAAFKRMFRLGLRQGMVTTMPYISLLVEHNVRKGFMELDQFHAILKHVPIEYLPLFELAYMTGWRIRSEPLSRQWRHVDFNGNCWLRIDAGEAKDATAGREFQFTTWMRDALERQRKFVSKVEKKTGQ